MKNYIDKYGTDIRIINIFDINWWFNLVETSQESIAEESVVPEAIHYSDTNAKLSIGHKLGLVYRDAEMCDLIWFNDEYVYLMDWNSSTFNECSDRCEAAFNACFGYDYDTSYGRKVVVFSASDCVSVIYILSYENGELEISSLQISNF